MPDYKKSALVGDKDKKKMVQAAAGRGASKYVSTDSPQAKRQAKAKKALEMKKAGKRLLMSEKMAIEKSFNASKERKDMPKTKQYKKK